MTGFKIQCAASYGRALRLTVACLLQVARGLPILPAVPLSRRERKHRANMALLPLGMAVLAAQSFVEQRLYSADICRNLIEG